MEVVRDEEVWLEGSDGVDRAEEGKEDVEEVRFHCARLIGGGRSRRGALRG